LIHLAKQAELKPVEYRGDGVRVSLPSGALQHEEEARQLAAPILLAAARADKGTRSHTMMKSCALRLPLRKALRTRLRLVLQS